MSTTSLGLTSCIQESDCGGRLACVAGACQACSAHDQCESDVCDQNAATSMGPGACVAQSSVVYVAASGGPNCSTGEGSRANPDCSIGRGISHAIGQRYAVRVYPGSYFPFLVDSRTVSVFGPGDGSAIVGEEDDSTAARIRNGAHVVLDGLDLDRHVLTGLVCEGATLKVARGSIKGDFHGMRATDCTLNLDRVRVETLVFEGLTVQGTGSYRITNSYFKGGDSPGVVFRDATTGFFAFNTVTDSGRSDPSSGIESPGGIDCGATARVIQDSIVARNAPAEGGAQTIGACTHQRVVVGSGDTRSDTGLIKLDPELDAQGRLLDTAANHACCIDRGARFVSSLYRDFFGTRRPQGASNDIGAHELSETPGCTREADCAAGLACVSGVCQACAAHGQCQSDVCDLSAATSEGPGACLPEASVVYVDDQHCTLEGDGSRTNPICRIADAIAQTTTSRYAIRVYPGHYRLFGGVDGGTVYFFGSRDGSVFVEGEEDTRAAIHILHGARVVLDGLDFGGALSSAIRCEASDLKVLRSTTRAENAGIRATDCNLQVDQVRATGSIFGLTISGAGNYRITNSYFRAGMFPAVVFNGANTGIFEFNTVTGGGSSDFPGGIDCGTAPRVIQDSIVIGGVPAAGGAQTIGPCIHQRVVVGSGDTRPDAGLISIDPDLDMQGRLLDTPADRACCIDQGAVFVPRLFRDFFGTPRPQGASNDIGAHELPE